MEASLFKDYPQEFRYDQYNTGCNKSKAIIFIILASCPTWRLVQAHAGRSGNTSGRDPVGNMRHLHMEIIQNKMINYTIKNDYSTYAPATGTKIILISLFYSKKTHHLQKYVSIFILNSQTKDNKAKEAGCTCHIIVQQ